VLHRDPSHDEMARLYAKYLWHLAEDIWTAQGYRVLDGAEDLLRRLGEAGVISGAMEGAARTKMEPGKLNRYFVFGAYGSDSADRTEVTRLAIAKAARLHGRDLAADEVYVVGDTPSTSPPLTPPAPPPSVSPAATTAPASSGLRTPSMCWGP